MLISIMTAFLMLHSRLDLILFKVDSADARRLVFYSRFELCHYVFKQIYKSFGYLTPSTPHSTLQLAFTRLVGYPTRCVTL